MFALMVVGFGLFIMISPEASRIGTDQAINEYVEDYEIQPPTHLLEEWESKKAIMKNSTGDDVVNVSNNLDTRQKAVSKKWDEKIAYYKNRRNVFKSKHTKWAPSWVKVYEDSISFAKRDKGLELAAIQTQTSEKIADHYQKQENNMEQLDIEYRQLIADWNDAERKKKEAADKSKATILSFSTFLVYWLILLGILLINMILQVMYAGLGKDFEYKEPAFLRFGRIVLGKFSVVVDDRLDIWENKWLRPKTSTTKSLKSSKRISARYQVPKSQVGETKGSQLFKPKTETQSHKKKKDIETQIKEIRETEIVDFTKPLKNMRNNYSRAAQYRDKMNDPNLSQEDQKKYNALAADKWAIYSALKKKVESYGWIVNEVSEKSLSFEEPKKQIKP